MKRYIACVAVVCGLGTACGGTASDGAGGSSSAIDEASDPASDAIVAAGKTVHEQEAPNEQYSAHAVVDGFIPNATLDSIAGLARDTGRWTEIVDGSQTRVFSAVDLPQAPDGSFAGTVSVQSPFTIDITVSMTLARGDRTLDVALTNTATARKYLVSVVSPGAFNVRLGFRPYRGGVIAHVDSSIKVNLREGDARADIGEYVFDWLKSASAR